uniref:GLOBIN domain-containing protein n=1 Tax=Globodera pallida TaxID=36090 RepID=A0A183BTN2_GLOPA
MNKIWHWFRGDNDPKFWQGAAASGDKRRWRSERAMARTPAGAKRVGADISRDFAAVQAASVSSPTVLLPSKRVKTVQDRLVLINGHEKRPSKSSVLWPANDQTKPPIPLSSSANQKGSRRRKSRGIAAAAVTTEDLPDVSTSTVNGSDFCVDKKSVSANEMDSKQRPYTLLQRIRQRFRKNGGRRSDMAERGTAVPSERRMTVTMTMAVETCQNGGNEQQQHIVVPMTQQRRGDYRLGGDSVRSGDALGEDDVSQGRCSSFDYFSATASPIDRQPVTERADVEPRTNNENNEDELRFATAAEARAYLRRQHGGAEQEEEEEEEEQEGCDADDEITTATTSAMCDSLLVQRRPHSAMATTAGQHESVYFTATVMVQSATTPDIARRRPPLQQQKGADQRNLRGLPRQKSRSQIALCDHGESAFGGIGGGIGSEPSSTKFARRRLRFVIPQGALTTTMINVKLLDHKFYDKLNIPAEENVVNNINNNDSEKFNDDNEQFLGAMNVEDLANNNNINSENNASLSGPEAEHESMLTEQDKQLRKALSEMDRRQLTLAQRRQSNMDVVHQASGRRTSTTLIPLTSAQIHLIRSLWRQVYLSKGPTVIGSQISHRLFFKEPETRELFRRCALPQQFANHDSFSKAHCKQISELIDQVVESLDDLEHVGPLLEQVGRCHAHISGGQLSSKLWNSVAETFIDCTLEWGDRRARSETVRKAWALIIAFMVERIKHGHLEERRHISAIRSTIASLERVAMASTTVQHPYYEVQQPTTSSSTQLPVPVSSFCHPIRRVSAFATSGGVPDNCRPGGPVSVSAGQWLVGAVPKYSVEVASSEACSAATFANASPYSNRRHAQLKLSERAEKKNQYHYHHRRSSSSSGHQSPQIGSVGTVRRKEGAGLAPRGSRTDSARMTTTNAVPPLSLGSMRKKMSTSNFVPARKQNSKSSTGGSCHLTDI